MIDARGSALLAWGVLVAGGCVQLLGDDFVVGQGGSAGGATTSPGGSGGVGGTTTVGGSGGQGGASPCVVGELGTCGTERKCSVVDWETGQTDCILAGPRPAFSRCDGDANCAEGTFCDPPSSVCLPVCRSEGDCSNGGPCIVPTDVDGNLIQGMAVCIANCNLIAGSPCDQSYGPVTCIPAGDGSLTHCWQGGGLSVGSPCSSIIDCAVGVVCASDLCHAWCTPPGVQADCPPPMTCVDVGISHEGVVYGVCA